MAFAVASNPSKNGSMNRQRKDRPVCTHCKIHTVDKCYKLHGYPPGYKTKQERANNVANSVTTQNDENTSQATVQPNQMVNASSTAEALIQCQNLLNQLQSQMNASNQRTTSHIAGTTCSFPLWIIDSGASTHISCCKSFFTSMEPCSTTIRLPNKQVFEVKTAGTIRLSEFIELKNVLYIPEFSFNLISVSALTRDLPINLSFSTNNCIIQDKFTLRKIGSAELLYGLYVFNLGNSSAVHSSICAVTNDNSSLWHQRLGHPSIETLKSLLLQLKFLTSHHCTTCPLAKQRKLSFPSNNHLSSNAFDLIHVDIWGPMSTATHAGYCYFLTIVDDATPFTWVFMLKQKSDVKLVIPQFFKLIETQHGKRIKQMRSDNAPEFKFTDFFKEKGVLHQFSCVNCPQQNSVVERKHQHILNTARALFFQSGIPMIFWGECVLTAVYLINRTPSRLLHWKSPFQLLNKNLPDYKNLKVFGSLSYASTLPHDRSKFQPRAIPAVFVGYPQGMKAYKLYNIDQQKFFVSRDVVFHEEVFPFKDLSAARGRSNTRFFSTKSLP